MKFVSTISSLGGINKYNQESVLIKQPDSEGGNVFLLYPASGKREILGKKVGFDKIARAYSVLRNGNHKGRKFVMEGIRIPSNHISAIGLVGAGYLF